MDYADIRRLSLKVFLGFLGLTALTAIVSVLAGEFGELQGKIVATTLTITVASICSMSCAAFIEAKKLKQVGLWGIVFSISAAVLLIAGLWSEIDWEAYWRTTATFGVFAIAFAHALLLLLPELGVRQKWVQTVSAISIGLLALLTVIAVWGDIDRVGYYRILAVVAIVVGLETLAVPILLKLHKADGQGSGKLVLERVREDIYRDVAGGFYRVREINPEQDTSQDREPAAAASPPAS